MCRDIVGNTICADLLDYLHRDWYHIGKPRQFDERILQYMEIRRSGNIDHFVISLGRRPKIRTDAVSAILGLLESRYELAESVLFHRTKCSAAAMLERGVRELENSFPDGERAAWLADLEKLLLDMSDDSALDYLIDLAEERHADAAIRPLQALRARRLYRSISTTFRDELTGDVSRRLLDMYTDVEDAPSRRNEAVRLLESDFGLQPGSLTMYCPDKAMNAKIAKVRNYINGSIGRFHEWEQENSKMLSGGHLEAQIHRFDRLWRVHVFLDRSEWDGMPGEKRELLRQAIEAFVLWRIPSESSLEDRAHSLAVLSAKVEGSPFLGMTPEPVLVGARGTDAVLRYPNGSPTLRSFFK
jgi:hypothetical protein